MTITANRTVKRRLRHSRSLETLVDFTANALFVIGAILALGVWLMISLTGQFSGFLIGFTYATFSLTGAFVQWVLFRCLAEHLRLQKKIAGVNFEGSISGPTNEEIWACGNCGQILHSREKCENCGAILTDDDVSAT